METPCSCRLGTHAAAQNVVHGLVLGSCHSSNCSLSPTSGTRWLGHLQPHQAPGTRLGAGLARLPVPSTELGHSPRGATTDLPGPPTPPGGADGTPEAIRRQLMSPPIHQQCQGWLPTSCLGAGEGPSPPSWTQGQSHGERQGSKGASRKVGASPCTCVPLPSYGPRAPQPSPALLRMGRAARGWAHGAAVGPQWGSNTPRLLGVGQTPPSPPRLGARLPAGGGGSA